MAIVQLNPGSLHLETCLPVDEKTANLRIAILEVKHEALKEKNQVQIEALNKKLKILQTTIFHLSKRSRS